MKSKGSLLKLRENMSILALGPHADDIELGCGATLLTLKKLYDAKIHYVVFSDHHIEEQAQVNRKKEIEESSGMLPSDTFDCLSFTDTQFPNHWRQIQDCIAGFRREYRPDLVFAPRLNDNHQDHVVVAEAARREFRNGEMIWHYEIKQIGQDQFDANIFIDVSSPSGCKDKEYLQFLEKMQASDTFAHRKIYILRRCFKSQLGKPSLDVELLLGIMKYRGMQYSSEIAYAEAFKGGVMISP